MEPADPPSLDLPPPLPDEGEEDPEAVLVRHVKASAKETLRLCADLVDDKPARGLALLEHYAKAIRSFLVEISEPEEALRKEDDGPRLRPHDENPYLRQANWEAQLVAGQNNPYRVTTYGHPHLRAADVAARPDVRRTAAAVNRTLATRGPEAAAMLDLVRINTNGLQFALRSARRLGDEGLMDQIRDELAQVIRVETGDEGEEEGGGGRDPIDLSQLDTNDLADLVLPDTTNVPFEDLGKELPEVEPPADDEGRRAHEYDTGTFVCRTEDVEEEVEDVDGEVQNPYADGTFILGHDLRDPTGRRALLRQLDRLFDGRPHARRLRRRPPFDLAG